MKKLALGIVIVSLAACVRPVAKLIDTRERVTLNGIPYDDASKMVAYFKQDNMSSADQSSMWLSKEWVDNVANYLEKNENVADGFRVYFAKDADKNNTVVIVSTLNDGPDAPSESKADHLDYFAHDAQFATTARSQPINEENTIAAGATLYKMQPTNCTGCFPGALNNNIKCDEAYGAVKNFRKEIITTNSEWFPLGLLTRLRDELDYHNSENHQDGVRIYFAKNGESPTNPLHKGKHSFIFVTTQIVGNTARTDYYNCYNPKKSTGDNGEQCRNNCNGVTLPTP